jgi:cell fate (sporulation/competence/biofilm development) regulator YmcA (YheA/YmcA/DUF963 family)
LGNNAKNKELPAMEVKDVLSGIEDRIKRNPLLREVYYRESEDFNDLIEKYSGEKVMMAVQLVESYRLLLEMEKSCRG